MKQLGLIALLVASVVAAQTWDKSFTMTGTATAVVASSTQLTVPMAAYVKVSCEAKDAGVTGDAYLGNGFSDAGCSSANCDRIWFSKGEKYYSKLGTFQNRVAIRAVGDDLTCKVFVASPQ